MNVLVSEVAGEGRWSQFNCKLKWVPIFFGQPLTDDTPVRLCTLSATGIVLSDEPQVPIYKPGSRNWAFEIPDASSLTYPAGTAKPIIVIGQRTDGRFPFELIMPSEGRYAALSAFLATHRQTPSREMARCIVDRSIFKAAGLGISI